MDDLRFDSLARDLGSPFGTRRRLLRGLLAAAGGALALLQPGGTAAAREADAEAARRGRGRGPNRRRRPTCPPTPQSDPRCPINKAFVIAEICPQREAGCGRDQVDLCVLAVDGSRQCGAVLGVITCPAADECSRDADCGSGQFCAAAMSCCPGNFSTCVPKAP